ncbi:hypothetical protein NQ318_011348 [Aromia moschata]|uniref:UBA domain-containing protein n=1 Tax=Aromia moschata TaxID=1265417 RepID=A0AAV8XGP2_9CUCU|nr:hypothetical protein NQ318_011348 [Aromia moschata]
MKEWRNVRMTVMEERKEREKVREELKKKEEETAEQEKIKRSGANSSILMPTQVSNCSNILTPIPLTNCINQQYISKPVDKSPFNLSDFENDTSSPFDNMELKSINDLEELAQVLKSEEPKYKVNNPVYPSYQNVQCSNPAPLQTNYPNYTGYATFPVLDHLTGQSQSFQVPYLYSKPSTTDYSCTSLGSTPLLESKKSNCKSVPDIIKSLEVELENSHLDNTTSEASYIRTNIIPQTSRPKSTEAVIYPRDVAKKEELDNPFNSLSQSQQDLCKSINSMGFPLSRVARSCKVIGHDHKKIVEHLLALSDLLDLGFSEKDASSALLQCDNDRDKALDKLIS